MKGDTSLRPNQIKAKLEAHLPYPLLNRLIPTSIFRDPAAKQVRQAGDTAAP